MRSIRLSRTVSPVMGLICTGLLFSGSVAPMRAEAQDRLPRDNGIFDYHQEPRYRESESHPFRLAAYVLHPIGWVAREVIVRPLSYFAGSTETRKSVMGFREPYDFREPTCFSADDSVPDCRSITPFDYASVTPSFDENVESGIDRIEVSFANVNFEFDKSSLSTKGKAQVADIAERIKAGEVGEGVSIVLEGHADKIGTEDYNMVLGKKRAEAVKAGLALKGISMDRLKTVSFGESRPVIDEETPAAYAANRRVEVHID